MAQTKKPLVFRDRDTKEKIPFYVKAEDVELPDGTDIETKVGEIEEALEGAADGTVKSVTLNGTKGEPDAEGDVALTISVPEVDDEMSSTSENPVQNKVIKDYVDGLIQGLQNVLNTITQDGATQGVIDTFNEIKAFLEGIDTDDPTLFNQLKSLSDAITALNNTLSSKANDADVVKSISVNGTPQTKTNGNVNITVEAGTLRILSIGNSFSHDSLSYVPIIMAQMGLNVEIGILYHSSCSLQMHWEHGNDANYYVFNYFSQEQNEWATDNNVKTLNAGIAYTDWDVVLFQQNSVNAYDYATVQPYLNNLIDLVAASLPRVTFGWILTHAWATGYSGYTSRGMTQAEYVEGTKDAAKSVMENTACQLLLPYGIAIDLARKDSTLSAIGDDLCEDTGSNPGVHLLEGIACQIAAYANATAIADFLHSKKSVEGDTTTVDSTWVNTYNIPEPNGSATGSTAANRKIAQRLAIAAFNQSRGLIGYDKSTDIVVVDSESSLPSPLDVNTIYGVKSGDELEVIYIGGIPFYGGIPAGTPAIIKPRGTTINLGTNDGSGVSKAIEIQANSYITAGGITVGLAANSDLSFDTSNLPSGVTYNSGAGTLTIDQPTAMQGVNITIVYSGSGAAEIAGGIVISGGGLSSAKSVTVVVEKDWEEVDLSNLEMCYGWIGQNNTWGVSGQGQYGKLLPIDNSVNLLKVTSHATKSAYLCFFKTKPTPSNGAALSGLATNETGRIVQTSNTTVEYNIPSDCAYVYIGLNSDASNVYDAYLPQYVGIK